MSLGSDIRKVRRIPYFKIIFGLTIIAFYVTVATLGRHMELKKIQATYQGFLALQKQQVGDAEWDSFKEKVHTEIDPIIKKLEATSSSSTPHLQHLLWASRDHLYPMLDNARIEKKP